MFASDLQGKFILTGEDLPHATAALAFSELEDVLVAVDHRGARSKSVCGCEPPTLVDDEEQAEELRSTSGIRRSSPPRRTSKPIFGSGSGGLEPSINSVYGRCHGR